MFSNTKQRFTRSVKVKLTTGEMLVLGRVATPIWPKVAAPLKPTEHHGNSQNHTRPLNPTAPPAVTTIFLKESFCRRTFAGGTSSSVRAMGAAEGVPREGPASSSSGPVQGTARGAFGEGRGQDWNEYCWGEGCRWMEGFGSCTPSLCKRKSRTFGRNCLYYQMTWLTFFLYQT